ncbi:MAG: DUF3037 domain-containing protein [Caldilineaceae bacterium]|nr:DUF3037 domain-containing protein [Caldilineaceae bacterium]
MPTLSSYDYAVVRVAPCVERGEFINVGVILFCRTQRFLAMRTEVDVERLRGFAPQVDPDQLQAHLESMRQLCQGVGPIGALGQAESFHWLVAPHSTIIHTSPVHSGLCTDPEQALEHLMTNMVRPPQLPA